jgi:hypothetical protein
MGWISKIIKFKIATAIGKKLINVVRNKEAVKKGDSPATAYKKVRHA